MSWRAALPPLPLTLIALGLSACRDHGSISGPQAEPLAIRTAAAPDTGVRHWNLLSDEQLWARLAEVGYVATVGLKTSGTTAGFDRGERLIAQADWLVAKQSLAQMPGFAEQERDTLIPWVRGRIADIQVLRRIRQLPFVEYVEPGLIQMVAGRGAWSSSCGQDSWADSYGEGVSFAGDVVPRIYIAMKIDKAWSLANGAGVTIGLTDTGIHRYQPELTSQFASGYSGGRWVEHHYVNSDPGDCSHGTHMAGTLAAPMNGVGMVGVAWMANLVDVLHDDNMWDVGAENAQASIRTAGNRGARVISMGWQAFDWFNQVQDEIAYWYYQRDVLFVGAAGTGDCDGPINEGNVVFPAELAEVLAVSAADVVDGHRPCHAHYGAELDLVAYHKMPTVGFGTDQSELERTEQSSNATGLTAGVAALLRQRYPTMKNWAVMDRLVSTAESKFVSPDNLGCGMVKAWASVLNALYALGGICVSPVVGTDYVEVSDDVPWVTKTYEVQAKGGIGSISYHWSSGATGPSTAYSFGINSTKSDYYRTVWVEVADSGASYSRERREVRVLVHYVSPTDCGKTGDC